MNEKKFKERKSNTKLYTTSTFEIFIAVQHYGSGSTKAKSYSSYGSRSATSTEKDTNFDTSLLSSSTWSPFSVSFQSVVSEAPLSSPSAEI